MGWVRTVMDAARRAGIAETTLLESAGLPPNAMARERWPIDFITRLWHAAERCTQDPGFGLKVGAGVRPASIDAVSFAMQSAATLRQAILLVQKYQRLISDGGRFQMLPGARATWVVYHPRQGQLAFSPHQIEAVLSAVVCLTSWIAGAEVRPLRVQFSQGQLGPMAGYREVFRCPVDFEQAFSGLLIANDTLEQPLPQADATLARVHEQYNEIRLAALENATDSGSVSAGELQRWLAEQLGPVPPRRDQAARMLGLSERTLARRLKVQGVTFNQLLDHARREQALTAVREGRRSLADIALSLGFAEPSTFYRAFVRWTGLPPARWRRQATDR